MFPVLGDTVVTVVCKPHHQQTHQRWRLCEIVLYLRRFKRKKKKIRFRYTVAEAGGFLRFRPHVHQQSCSDSCCYTMPTHLSLCCTPALSVTVSLFPFLTAAVTHTHTHSETHLWTNSPPPLCCKAKSWNTLFFTATNPCPHFKHISCLIHSVT